MKKTREYASLPKCTALLLLACIASMVTVTAICTLTFWLCSSLDDKPSTSALSIIFYTLIFLGMTILFFYIYFEIIEQLLGYELDDTIHCYIDSYALTDTIVLPHQASCTDFRKAQTTVRFYIQYSYEEIEAFYRQMRRKKAAYKILPSYELPTPLIKLEVAISRRTAKRILKEMSPRQYVVFSRKEDYDYNGEELTPTTMSYVSRRDIRRIFSHPQWATTGQVQVCNSIGNFTNVRIDIINAWSDQLTKEEQCIATGLEHNAMPKF